MSRIERSIEIAASQDAVWSTIARLDAVATWNPNVKTAACGQVASGTGATRTCQLALGHVDEVVSEWVDGEQLWFAIGSHGAIRSADMGLVLRPSGAGTTVTAIADYHVALGPLGAVINQISMKRLMARMLDTSLAGLKRHLETANAEGESSS
ncbi:MAG: SRPBCC family protein [Gaiellaceae bacterium]